VGVNKFKQIKTFEPIEEKTRKPIEKFELNEFLRKEILSLKLKLSLFSTFTGKLKHLKRRLTHFYLMNCNSVS
jgi:hypothetical protein